VLIVFVAEKGGRREGKVCFWGEKQVCHLNFNRPRSGEEEGRGKKRICPFVFRKAPSKKGRKKKGGKRERFFLAVKVQ